jgi:hypothetical protein
VEVYVGTAVVIRCAEAKEDGAKGSAVTSSTSSTLPSRSTAATHREVRNGLASFQGLDWDTSAQPAEAAVTPILSEVPPKPVTSQALDAALTAAMENVPDTIPVPSHPSNEALLEPVVEDLEIDGEDMHVRELDKNRTTSLLHLIFVILSQI